MKILVTGATGNIAGNAIPGLIKGGAEVRALVRSTEKAQPLAKMGVELIEGDFDNEDSLNKASQGVDAIFAITPAGPEAVKQGDALLKAAVDSGSPFYLRLSAIGAAPDAPTDNGRLHFQSDEAVIKSGLPYTILRPHFFMQNLFASVPTINEGNTMYWGMGDGNLGMIDVRDIADCAISLLFKREHDNKVFTLTGPESITFHDIAGIIGKDLGKEITYVPIPIEAVGEAIREAGWGEWGAQVMMDYSKAYASGWGDFTTDQVEIITGNKPRSFKQFFDEVLSMALAN